MGKGKGARMSGEGELAILAVLFLIWWVDYNMK
jgi:hypothetical protein